MKPTLFRSYGVTDVELRGGDGRTIFGLAAPFNKPARIHEHGRTFDETILPGAFARTIAARARKVPLFAQHQSTRLPLGPVQTLEESIDGLVVTARLSATRDADEVRELVRDGALGAFSIGFSPVREAWSRDDSRRELYEVKLHEISVVALPAYEDALIAGVRSELHAPQPSMELLTRRLALARLQGSP
jgi:hypothetical protein